MEAQRVHLANVMAYRKIQSRLCHMSEQSTGAESGISAPGGGVLKLDMDFCDQSKFRVPRNCSSSKSLDNLWRPQISLGSALVWGVAC